MKEKMINETTVNPSNVGLTEYQVLFTNEDEFQQNSIPTMDKNVPRNWLPVSPIKIFAGCQL